MTTPKPNITIEPSNALNYVPRTVSCDGEVIEKGLTRYDAISLKKQLLARWRAGKRVWPIRDPMTGEVD